MKYYEYPLKAALQLYPILEKIIPLEVDRDDDDYIIRISFDGLIEFGYPNDPEWVIR